MGIGAYIGIATPIAINWSRKLPQRLYLDHAATTPLVPAARAAMVAALDTWANPSSPHADGRAARAALEDARARIAKALGWNEAVLFTGGATEALSIALTRATVSDIAVSAVEHDAVLRCVPEAERLPVDVNGLVRDDRRKGLVAIQQVNNETGVIQPLGRVEGRLLLADCAQSAGKLPLPDADFIAISAHKLGGPPGVGALLVRDLATLKATGGQEQGYRAGTENLPAILGFAAALDARTDWMERAQLLRARLESAIPAEVVGAGAPRIPTIGAYRMPGVPANAQLIRFDLAGISVSAGSACSSGSLKPSHVLAAMGMDGDAAREVIRVSFGPATTEADVDRFAREWLRIAR